MASCDGEAKNRDYEEEYELQELHEEEEDLKRRNPIEIAIKPTIFKRSPEPELRDYLEAVCPAPLSLPKFSKTQEFSRPAVEIRKVPCTATLSIDGIPQEEEDLLKSFPEPEPEPRVMMAECPALLSPTKLLEKQYFNTPVVEIRQVLCTATLSVDGIPQSPEPYCEPTATGAVSPLAEAEAEAEAEADNKYLAAVMLGHMEGNADERLRELKTKFGHSTNKVNNQGEDKWSALQLAAAFGDDKIVEELCNYKLINLVQQDADDDTPLHAAAYWDHDKTIEIILNTTKNPDDARKAINMYNKAKETPFTNAATRFHRKSCAMMIRYSPPLNYTFDLVHPGRNPGSQGFEKDSGIFGKLRTKEAVKKFEKINEHIIKYHQRNGQGKTAINIMITKMPELVVEILNKSIITSKADVLKNSSKGSENKHEDIKRVIVDFGALENYGEEEKEDEKKMKPEEQGDKELLVKVYAEKGEEHKETKVEVEKIKTKKEERDKKEEEETGKPLTSGYYKHGSNPLQIMAKMNHSLLTHPVVEALIVTKWEKFARTYFYIFTFLLYLIFFSVLMGYQYTQIKPFELLENDKAVRSWIENSSHTCDEFPDGCSKKKSAECDIFGYILMVMSAIRLFLELLDLLDNVFIKNFNGSDLESGSNSPLETGKAWLQGLMNYLIDAENWLEVILYSSCLFFSLNVLELQRVMSPFHWKIGALAVLTSFINLLLLLQVFPHIGIYIIMFFKIAWTFVSKILSLLAFFLIAFMVVFHMLLSHTNVFRKILSADAIFKTLSAGVSGIEYDDYADQEMIYPTTTLVGLIAFALFVQVLFLNLATALAIDDVDAIRGGAEKAINALKIKHIYNAERIANLIQWVAKPIFCGSAPNFLKHQKRFRNMPAKRFKEDRLESIITFTENSWKSEKSEICTKKCTGKCTEKSENLVIPFLDFYEGYRGQKNQG